MDLSQSEEQQTQEVTTSDDASMQHEDESQAALPTPEIPDQRDDRGDLEVAGEIDNGDIAGSLELPDDAREEDRPVEYSSEPSSGDERGLGMPGDVGESNVPLANADRPMESDEPTLPVSEIEFDESGGLPVPTDPIQDAGWTADMPTEPPSAPDAAPAGAEHRQRDPFDIPPGFFDQLTGAIEPELEQLRSAVQTRAAALIEDQAIMVGMAGIPE